MNLIVSGFETFGDLSKNPTIDILHALEQEQVEDVTLTTVILPVVYQSCFHSLNDLIDDINPDAILCLGVAAGRSSIQPERIGINLEDLSAEGQGPDNNGDRPIERKILEETPDAYFSTLPNAAITAEIQAREIPSTVSNSAGTFICNTVLYRLMHKINSESRNIPAGFIHVPATPDMVTKRPDLPSMHLDNQVEGIRRAIQVIRDSVKLDLER
ncbi:pyroglutamyl-peptidase I [Salisediminibacterium beveridgei]|uniref:Pyroglutamyl-peptidase I n=1 Tax=Salisediminibacterium beveridgei TaxID=632773 RepID=A0A1D7QWR3_9BACI|nr:pyroglutamyl-peptidase I [Salisediminibacterium beveridgei]AOM83442.1 Pyrrolidone-carboxylate peptidase [Salisediminibacterium beveridgei]